jgi:hypothetical protein
LRTSEEIFIQLDGSDHERSEQRDVRCTLLMFPSNVMQWLRRQEKYEMEH